MERIEALADALMKLNGWGDPASQAYQNRNPLLLRAFSLSRAQPQDDKGVRIFDSLLGGYRAGLTDLMVKCGGHDRKSRAKLEEDSPLRELLRVFQLHLAERKAVLFLQAALRDDAVHGRTPLGWFLQTSVKEVASGE